MKIIITENQNFLLRRINSLINIVEDVISSYETTHNWCSYYKNSDDFVESIIRTSVREFYEEYETFFTNTTGNGGSKIDVYSFVDRIITENYENYLRNIYVRQCNSSRY